MITMNFLNLTTTVKIKTATIVTTTAAAAAMMMMKTVVIMVMMKMVAMTMKTRMMVRKMEMGFLKTKGKIKS